MKKIEILGSGCSKCQHLLEKTEKNLKELGIDYQIDKVTDMNTILNYGVMMTPAIVVDGEVKITGRVPDDDEIKNIIS